MQLLDAISQRKTIKLFDKSFKLSREQLSEMLCVAQLAPSKANLQPWRFVVVESEAQKQKLLGHVAFNAPPCESAAALVLVLADLQYDKLLETVLDCSIEGGCLMPQFKQNSLAFLRNMHQSLSPQQLRDQVLIDSSLAAMQLMLVVKQHGLDSHAIGIFDQQAVLAALEVDSERYVPVMLLAIGKAAVPALPSVRLPLEYTVSWNDGKGFSQAD